MTRLAQDVSEQGTALQANRDINIGLGPNELRQIIEALTAQLPAFAAIAREIVETRMKEFEDRILKRFADERTSRAEAFKEPDFQYVIGRAQQAYARSGDQDTLDMLANLVAERSKQTDRGRLALILNQAVEKSAILTRNEFSALSLGLLMQIFQMNNVLRLQDLANFLNQFIIPLLPDISEEEASYSYLESQGCARKLFVSNPLHKIFTIRYGGVLTSGFSSEQLKDHTIPEDLAKLYRYNYIIPCVNNSEMLQLAFLNKDTFSSKSEDVENVENIWRFFESTFWSEEEVIQNLTPEVPEISQLFQLWSTTDLRSLEPTSVGILIAHARLADVDGFDIDVSLLVK